MSFYHLMWDELKCDLNKDLKTLQEVSREQYKGKDDRINGKIEGVRLALDRLLIIETLYEEDQEEGE